VVLFIYTYFVGVSLRGESRWIMEGWLLAGEKRGNLGVGGGGGLQNCDQTDRRKGIRF
jgi:hypothetical protein